MIKAIDMSKGKVILFEGTLYTVHEVAHVAKGNKRSYMQTKLKDLVRGGTRDVRFTVNDRVETPFLEQKEHEYLYREGDHLVLMDTASYDQIHLPVEDVGDAVNFLKPNERVQCQMYQGRVVMVELPLVVELTITDTPPVVRGATVTNQPKDAVLETGARVRVPAFIEPGERIRVDTRTGQYIERAK